jgi:centromeric protein E
VSCLLEKEPYLASTSMSGRLRSYHLSCIIESRAKTRRGRNDDSSGGDGAVLAAVHSQLGRFGGFRKLSVRQRRSDGRPAKRGGMINQEVRHRIHCTVCSQCLDFFYQTCCSLFCFIRPLSYSLLTLSRVIVALGTPNQTHISFRDSKLTRILQPSLSGNARI